MAPQSQQLYVTDDASNGFRGKFDYKIRNRYHDVRSIQYAKHGLRALLTRRNAVMDIEYPINHQDFAH